jgi:hypothetical protein
MKRRALETTPDQEARINEVARQLREALRPVLRAAAGEDPRPMKLARAIDIDKSLASVLVRAVNSKSDRDLLHIVPSPTGLRILSQRTKGVASRTASARLEAATERFRRLLEATPGGRAALDARIAETSRELGWKRQHTSKQATFKSMSFLLGYYCDLMSSALMLVPTDAPGIADSIEITRRVGVRRMRSTATIPLFSFTPWSGDGPDRIGPIVPDANGSRPENLLLPEFCSDPMPAVEVVNEGSSFAVVLPGTMHAESAMDFAWAFRHQECHRVSPETDIQVLHAYFLHMPTRRVVRDLFIAESIYEGVEPIVTWALPGTRQHENPPRDGASNYYARVELDAEYEPLGDSSKRAYAIPGMPGQDRMIQSVLERTGHAKTRFRGWRCTLEYPVPLLDMFVWLKHR